MAPRALLLSPVLGWTQEMGPHRLHDMTRFATLWFALLVPVAPLLAFVPLAGFGPAIDSPIAMSFVTGVVLTLVAFAFHPVGRSALRFDRVATVEFVRRRERPTTPSAASRTTANRDSAGRFVLRLGPRPAVEG